MANTLKIDFIWTFAGTIVYRLSQWMLLVLIAKFTNPENVGQYSFAVALVTPLLMFSQMQLRSIIATDYTNNYSFSNYLCFRIIALSSLLVVIIVSSFIFFNDSITRLVVIAVCLSRIFESLGDICFGLFQKVHRMDFISKSMCIKGVLSIILLSIVMLRTRNLVLSILSISVSNLLIFIIYDIRNIKSFTNCNIKIDWIKSKNIFTISYPLGIVLAITYFQGSVPRFIIKYYHGNSSLGFFSAISYVVVIGNFFIMSIGHSVVSRLGNYYTTNLKYFIVLLLKFLLIAVIMGTATIILGIFFGKQFLTLIYKPEYAEYSNEFNILLISVAFSYVASVFGVAITSAKFYKPQVPQNILVIICTIISGLILIPNNGIRGGAETLIIANIARCLTSGILTYIVIHKQKCILKEH